MCGRYTLTASAEAIRLLFEVPGFDERRTLPRYNIAPTQPIVIVRKTPRGRELVPMRRGLIPWWRKDTADLPAHINARMEGIAEKPAFRDAYRYRRCLVPASGFYEWQARGRSAKQPFFIRPRDAELIAFAGIWETWHGGDRSEIDTVAIITTDSNESLRVIHDRMPAILRRKDFPPIRLNNLPPRCCGLPRELACRRFPSRSTSTRQQTTTRRFPTGPPARKQPNRQRRSLLYSSCIL
jgi:putative SOS response-associated peptidase YedK